VAALVALGALAVLGVLAVLVALVVRVVGHGSAADSARNGASHARIASAPRNPGQPAFLPIPAGAARDSLGINAQFLFPLLNAAQWPQHIQEMRQAGIQLARVSADWGDAEPAAPDSGGHRYSWNYFDAVAGSLASAGIRWLPVVAFSTAWDASYSPPGGQPTLSPPRDPSLFVDYAAAFVARYGPEGSFWRSRPALPDLPVRALEIWNEENIDGFWKPTPDPAAYLRLYEAARMAVHRVSRQIEVLVGGLANPAEDYLSELYVDSGGHRGLFDGVAIHPYAPSPQGVLDEVMKTRAVLDAHGDLDTPIDVTEFGWPTAGALPGGLPDLSDRARAAALSQVTATMARSDCGVERILPHTWVTLERNLRSAEDWFGLVHPDGAFSASATAYAATVRGFEQAPQPVASVPLCGRSLGISLARVSVPRVPAARGPAARGAAAAGAAARGAGSRGGQLRVLNGCVAAILSSSSTAVDGAAVRFTLTPGPGRAQPRASQLTRRTDRAGRAVACFQSHRATSGNVEVTGSRPDFATPATARVWLRIR
jgi:hypothetical protein